MSARLGLGTATFIPGYGLTSGGRPGPELLDAALDAGVRYVDTAAAYADSEATLGLVADRVRALAVRVATKLHPAATTAASCREAMAASLARLRLDSADTVLLHSASVEQVASASGADAWIRLRDAGLATRIGASTYGVEAARVAVAAPWCDAVQVEFSILNQSVVGDLAARNSRPVEVIARSVLCKGLLTASARALPLPDDAATTLRELDAVAADLGTDLTTLAIRFALDTPGIDVVLVGVSSRAELDVAAAAAARPPLTAEQYRAVAAFDRSAAEWTHPERWREGTLA
jgi:aryl-alcohol dehydrogenase-like predicted oxidoreductase